MNKILPETPGDVARQIDHYEWLKRTFPDLYTSVVQMAEQRPERGL